MADKILSGIITDKSSIEYICFGKELGPKTGEPHLQGYLESSKPISMKSLKALFGCETIHLEPRRGTQQQAIDYCKKDGDFHEIGIKKQQGKRNDLCAVRKLAQDGGIRAVVESCDNYQQVRLAECYLTYKEDPRDWKPIVLWLYGGTGLGKSRRARHFLETIYQLEGDQIYTKSDGTKWWPGYDGHRGVIIDDFRDSWWSITEMLRLLDRYECKVEYKGGYRQFKPTHIIITSCLAPTDCYSNTGEAIKQLTRRIDETHHFIFQWQPPEEEETAEVINEDHPAITDGSLIE